MIELEGYKRYLAPYYRVTIRSSHNSGSLRQRRMTSLLRIAFLTYCGHSDLTADDRLAAVALEEQGITVEAVPWDHPDALSRLQSFDAVVVRSTWNYTEEYHRFLRWIDQVQSSNIHLLNGPKVLRWNSDKIYLRELEAQGHAVLPTRWIDHGCTVNLGEALESLHATRAIVKPRVSATAWGLFLTTLDQAHDDQHKLEELLLQHDVMLQPFADEITERGEWSLVFFGGLYSHAVIKRAKSGDHRVQSNFGGTHTSARPSDLLRAAAQAVVDQCAQEAPLLYARVDGIERDDRLVIMELELIEPELFFRADPDAALRFAQALMHRLTPQG